MVGLIDIYIEKSIDLEILKSKENMSNIKICVRGENVHGEKLSIYGIFSILCR